MPEATAVRRERSLMELTDILRRVAGAVRGLKDFDQFVGGAARLYQGVSTLAGRKIGFDPVVDGKALPLPISQTPAINAPISSGDALAGFVRVYPSEETRQFGPEDLHIAGALADLTAALVDVSIQLRGGDGLEQMMRQITDQLPLGLVCFLPSGELVIANAQSRVMLGGFVWKTFSDAWEFLRERSESGEIPEGPGRFSVSLPSGTVHVEIKEVETGGVPTCTVVTMAQFTANERQLVQALERESYRSRWLKQPLSFLAIRAVGDPTDLFASIPGARKSLNTLDECQYLGSREIGFVLPGRDRVQALQIARDVCRRVPKNSVRIGCAQVGGLSDNVDAIIEETLANLEAVDELLKPRLLVVDRYPAIPETVHQVMRGQVMVEYASDYAEGLRKLQATPVDGIIVEHEPDSGLSGLQFVSEARSIQPDVPALLSTTLLGIEATREQDFAKVGVLRKPFSVRVLRSVLEPLLPSLPEFSSDR